MLIEVDFDLSAPKLLEGVNTIRLDLPPLQQLDFFQKHIQYMYLLPSKTLE